MANLTGTTIDKYEMLDEVGHGGMAVVYRGRDRVLDREVAVKVLHPHLADREESRLRLQREAIAVAKLRHENILEIFDYSGPEADESYIVTEFIHGPTLREWIELGQEPRPALAATIVHRLCLALCHAHKGAIIHRDIKPENVMIRLEDGVIKLMDFGIAQIIDNKKLTLTGQLIGSPAYMAPELISGRPLDARTDLFSLGILLYQLATGELPFNGRNPHEVLTRIADGQYPPPSSVCPLVDRDLEAIIDRSLALNPDDRYQSVDTFANELEEYLAEMGLEPGSTELGEYFRNPQEYVAELDARVCAALVQQADKAGAAGSTARAIRLLGRVLELSPEHRGAKSMLGRFKLRERRSRQLLLGAAGLAVAGLVSAGYMLMPPASQAGDGRTDGADSSGAVAKHVSRNGDDDARDDTALGGTPEEAGQPGTGADDSDAASFEPVDGPTGDGPAEPTDADAGQPDRPRPKPRIKVGTRPGLGKRPPKDAMSVTTACTLQLTGVPASQVASLKLTVAGAPIELTGPKVEIDVPTAGAEVRINHQRFTAKRMVKPEQCPATISIRPKPARVKFDGIPSDTVIRCTAGCPDEVIGKNILHKRFPALALDDPNGVVIAVTFQHTQYENLKASYTVHPGPNSFEVNLKPR